MSKHALILDADFLVYQAMSASEVETKWDDDVYTLECDHNQAWEILNSSIENIIAKRKAWMNSKIIMCFTDKVNWRKEVLPTYKANRKGNRKPTGYVDFVDRCMQIDEWNSFLRPTLEGDDCMGILATMPKLVGCESATIASPDKDFKTIPCEFFWMTTGEILTITEEEADYWHMYQTLVGDTTDGYKGCPQIGATKAPKILEDNKDDMWSAVVKCFEKAKLTEEDALVQARVARICRYTDYDFKTKEVKLWTP